VQGVRGADIAVAVAFVVAAATEAVVRHHGAPGPLVLDVSGALWLGSLAFRRRRPLVPMALVCGAAVVGPLLAQQLWPDVPDTAGVWLFAIMLASYSLGAHGRGPAVVLGVVLPAAVALAADLTTRSGWPLVSGVVFITVFTGLAPMAVGRLVRTRHDRLVTLRDQQETIVHGLRAHQESVVLAERLQTAERLHPTLLQGMRDLAEQAEGGASPADVEAAGRLLLERTRHEVVALTAPVDQPAVSDVPSVDHVRALRATAQPWAAVAGCAVAAGLSVEATRVLTPSLPLWLTVTLSVLVGVPVAFMWWRPLVATAAAFGVAAVFSRLVAPLDGSLSETGVALALAFGVGALSRRRWAAVGLALCWVGQLVGVGTDDPLGEATILLMCWLAGLAVNEASRLVEQSRANNELITGEQVAALTRVLVEERLRFSRELHDAVGSSLTVIVLQAGGARRLAGTAPERAREAMRHVAAAAREAVAALEPGASGEVVPDIAGLVERVRATGLVVAADLSGVERLDPAARALVHRVVQEALTNVLRHARGSRAAVTVRAGDESVEVSVVNTAPTETARQPGSGRGLAGIRERVTDGAGAVSAGPRPDGGFEVRAVLPLRLVTQAAP
jgi:signal transduction histidine kinase